MVEDLSPATSHPSFRDSILPRRLHARALHFQSGCSQEGDDVGVKLRVPVEDDVTIRGGLGKSLPQLLDNPFRRRVSSHVEVKDLAPSVLNHKEAIEQLEGDRRYCEEIEGGDAFNTAGWTDPGARGSSFTRDQAVVGSLTTIFNAQSVGDLRFQVADRRAALRTNDFAGPSVDIAGLLNFGRPYTVTAIALRRTIR